MWQSDRDTHELRILFLTGRSTRGDFFISNTLSLGAGFLCKDQGRFLGIVACGGASALWPKGIGLDVAFQEWFYESTGG